MNGGRSMRAVKAGLAPPFLGRGEKVLKESGPRWTRAVGDPPAPIPEERTNQLRTHRLTATCSVAMRDPSRGESRASPAPWDRNWDRLAVQPTHATLALTQSARSCGANCWRSAYPQHRRLVVALTFTTVKNSSADSRQHSANRSTL
jgi:hypothetical protein